MLLKGGDILAKEAIIKIEEAEKIAEENVEKAFSISNDLLKNAEAEAEKVYDLIIEETKKKVHFISDEATKEGKMQAEPILKACEKEVIDINNISQDKFELAVNMVIERIVKFNGNS